MASFLTIPTELVLDIFDDLDGIFIINTSLTCSRFHTILEELAHVPAGHNSVLKKFKLEDFWRLYSKGEFWVSWKEAIDDMFSLLPPRRGAFGELINRSPRTRNKTDNTGDNDDETADSTQEASLPSSTAFGSSGKALPEIVAARLELFRVLLELTSTLPFREQQHYKGPFIAHPFSRESCVAALPSRIPEQFRVFFREWPSWAVICDGPGLPKFPGVPEARVPHRLGNNSSLRHYGPYIRDRWRFEPYQVRLHLQDEYLAVLGMENQKRESLGWGKIVLNGVEQWVEATGKQLTGCGRFWGTTILLNGAGPFDGWVFTEDDSHQWYPRATAGCDDSKGAWWESFADWLGKEIAQAEKDYQSPKMESRKKKSRRSQWKPLFN